jgi:hypothetical protein
MSVDAGKIRPELPLPPCVQKVGTQVKETVLLCDPQEGLSNDGSFIEIEPPQLSAADAKNKKAMLAIERVRIVIFFFPPIRKHACGDHPRFSENSRYFSWRQVQMLANSDSSVP